MVDMEGLTYLIIDCHSVALERITLNSWNQTSKKLRRKKIVSESV
jgi:hypothetical protein